MTREQAIQIYMKDSLSTLDNIAVITINKIYCEFEDAKCNNCKFLQDEVCVNSYSPMCSDYPDVKMMCSKWEKKYVQ